MAIKFYGSPRNPSDREVVDFSILHPVLLCGNPLLGVSCSRDGPKAECIGVMGTIRMDVSDRAETKTPRDTDLYTYLTG